MSGWLVKSSNLSAVDYDPWRGVLIIEFHGQSVYEYYGVPRQEFQRLMKAESHGRYFHTHIKNGYRYRRLQ